MTTDFMGVDCMRVDHVASDYVRVDLVKGSHVAIARKFSKTLTVDERCLQIMLHKTSYCMAVVHFTVAKCNTGLHLLGKLSRGPGIATSKLCCKKSPQLPLCQVHQGCEVSLFLNFICSRSVSITIMSYK